VKDLEQLIFRLRRTALSVTASDTSKQDAVDMIRKLAQDGVRAAKRALKQIPTDGEKLNEYGNTESSGGKKTGEGNCIGPVLERR
jgi:hypothetical protein